MSRITIRTLNEMKKTGEKFAMMTCYDASFARILDNAGMECLLVGDSLGFVIQGKKSSVPVTVEDIIYHTENVARNSRQAMILADMPFMSYATIDRALYTAEELMQRGGAHMLKLEGGASQIEAVRALSDNGVAICAHLGLQPQFINRLGAWLVQGRESKGAQQMITDAHDLQEAGALMLLLECVPSILAAEITQALDIPVVGIGAGPDTDAQVMVLYDAIGISPGKAPRFVRNFLAETDLIDEAIQLYISEVKAGHYPDAEHSFS